MFSPAVHNLVLEFSEFWCSMKRDRCAGLVHEWIIHRVREEWSPWWISLPMERRIRIVNDLPSLKEEECKWLLQSLRITIEADCEKNGSLPNGPGSGDWVFMQLAHIVPFEDSGLFAEWRLDQVAGFKALCLHPNKSLPILSKLLRRGDESPHYPYNGRLRDAVGVSSALAAVAHLLKRWNAVFFNGQPGGCAHQPLALRLPLVTSLILGPLCVASIYFTASIGHLKEAWLILLLNGAYLSSMLFLSFWFIGIFSDWRAQQRLAATLDNNQVAWAFGSVLPSPTSRNSLEIEGESFSAALALSILHSLVALEKGINCWVSWCVRRASRNMKTLGITGDLSPTGKVLSVAGFDDAKNGKKAICIRERLTLLSPDQEEATATAAEVAEGLCVKKCASLEGMIWAAANHRSGFALWLGATSATLLVLFSFFARNLVLPAQAPDLDVSQPPIIEDKARHIQHLVLHFRTSCPECFILRVHSRFWKTPGEQRLAQVKDSNVAVFEIELVPETGTAGSGMDSSIEIQRIRELPFLPLTPGPAVEEITFARINDMYERSKGVGKYAYPNH